ncbi:MAG TPA: TrbI/VirB10 family protein [Phenylobacterium sp.]|nr:TrbI/VirB10 family protein [Phenylobacterium sp.]
MSVLSENDDPRLTLSDIDRDPSFDGEGPAVAQAAGGGNPLLIGGVFALAAVGLFLFLNAGRLERENRLLTTPVANVGDQQVAAAPPLALPSNTMAGQGPLTNIPSPAGTDNSAPPPPAAMPVPPPPGAPVAQASDALARRSAPAVVVELGEGGRVNTAALVAGAGAMATPVSAAGAPGADAAAQAASAAAGPAAMSAAIDQGSMNSDERFASRIGGDLPERARATTLRNLSTLAPQGTIITGVLETAINSDLPGYTRAVVSRDVRSFDGKQVLIPRGSRLIGQYKSAVSLGQSRAFVIWTRVIRPDGVSIQIGSPGGDELGRGGMTGEVNRHFFRRFGGSILLSVLNAGVASVSDNPSTQITIGSPAAAAGAAAGASFGENISPTIKVKQGEAIRIFVARDLDFSGVAPVL